jgi:hypothetical protein
MEPQIATASKIINAPAALLYEILADYRNHHPRILPKPYFLSLEVEEGGFGAGTIIDFKMRILGQTRSFRSLITEPEPGKVLVETDLASHVATRFIVFPLENEARSQVTIITELQGRNRVENFFAKLMLQKVYVKELEQLAHLAEELHDWKPSSRADHHSALSS